MPYSHIPTHIRLEPQSIKLTTRPLDLVLHEVLRGIGRRRPRQQEGGCSCTRRRLNSRNPFESYLGSSEARRQRSCRSASGICCGRHCFPWCAFVAHRRRSACCTMLFPLLEELLSRRLLSSDVTRNSRPIYKSGLERHY